MPRGKPKGGGNAGAKKWIFISREVINIEGKSFVNRRFETTDKGVAQELLNSSWYGKLFYEVSDKNFADKADSVDNFTLEAPSEESVIKATAAVGPAHLG